MDALLRVFKRISGVTDMGGDGTTTAPAAPTCSVRLLVASSQAINLIGKQGTLIKSIQETSGATVRVLSRGIFFKHLRDVNDHLLNFISFWIFSLDPFELKFCVIN